MILKPNLFPADHTHLLEVLKSCLYHPYHYSFLGLEVFGFYFFWNSGGKNQVKWWQGFSGAFWVAIKFK